MNLLSKFIRYATILLALGGFYAIAVVAQVQQDKQMPPAGEPPIAPPEKPFKSSVAGTGILEASSENVAVGVPAPGLVAAVSVKVNQEVKKGDPLFQLDDRDLRAELPAIDGEIAVAQSQIAVEEALLKKIEAQFERLNAIKDTRAFSVEDLDNRRNDVRVAVARLAAARASLTAASAARAKVEALIERLTVRASRDGTVLQVNIREGEFAGTIPKAPAMIIGDTDKLQVRVDIDEQSATRVRPGKAARASLRGKPEISFPLVFDRIEPYVIPKVSLTGASTERVDTRVLQVIYSMTPPENPPVYVGQQVDVFIEAEE
ncbi:MAG: HlyD family secretion protein [Verrucomicrobiales bacterium]